MADGDQKRLQCPRCEKEVSTERGARSPYFPFCSRKCKLLDLGNWLEGRYSITEEKNTGASGQGKMTE